MDVTLLRAVKAALQTANIVGPRNVFLTPHENFFPTGARCPAIGIKDGRSVTTELAGDYISETIEVKLIAWVMMTIDGEEAVVGDSGVVPLTLGIQRVLDGNRLDMGECHHARLLSSEPSIPFVTDNKQWMVKKTTTIRYDLEYARADR
jgi:hypothetical protein